MFKPWLTTLSLTFKNEGNISIQASEKNSVVLKQSYTFKYLNINIKQPIFKIVS